MTKTMKRRSKKKGWGGEQKWRRKGSGDREGGWRRRGQWVENLLMKTRRT
jgi:hypothetical protein